MQLLFLKTNLTDVNHISAIKSTLNMHPAIYK